MGTKNVPVNTWANHSSMGEEIDDSEDGFNSYKDVARACTRWLIKRGIYSREMSFRETLDCEAKIAMKRREMKRQREEEKLDRIVDEMSEED